MKEFELIEYISKKFKGDQGNKNLVVPIGDDCSVIKPPAGKLQITTADSLVEGNHFTNNYFTPKEIGQKSLRVNLSDLASMGAAGPYYAWLTLTLTPNIPDHLLTGILGGLRSDCKKYGVTLAGGNITSAREFSIHLTLSGWGDRKNLLRRDGAKKGDSIFLSGTVGSSSLAYQQYKNGKRPDSFLLKRWANPNPKVELGIKLAKSGIATSCIDISDGIFQDLRHITDRSKLGAIIDWSALPFDPDMKKLNPTPSMIGFGEDYELLFTVPEKHLGKMKKLPGKITKIGGITAKGFKVLDKDGNSIDVSGVGYSHL